MAHLNGTHPKALQCLNYHMEQAFIEYLSIIFCLCDISHRNMVILSQVGRWAVDNSTGKTCLSSCTRQENPVEISYYKFPNEMFLNSEDIIRLVKKLAVACDPLVKMYGPKRPLLDARYPKLCPIFDQISNDDLAANVDAGFTVHHFFKGLNLSRDELASLKEQLMAYASDNLVKINAFLDSPYLSKYKTEEVSVL